MKPLNVYDYRELAQKRLPRGIFEYIDRGTEDEVLLRELRRALDALKIVQHVLEDVTTTDTAVRLFGETLAMPTIIAPTAAAGLVWHDGEVQVARAARTAGIPFCIATQSMTSMEEIADRAEGASLWFQLYQFRDRELSLGLVQRARDLGITKLLLTVDTARSPKKEWNTRNGFGIPIKPSLAGAVDVATHPRWLFGVLLKYLVTTGMPTYAHYPPAYRTSITRAAVWDNVQLARDLSWAEVDALRRLWDGEFIIKGIMSKHDAVKARDAGADGIVVSSHGGRNFDSAPAAITLLPEIRTAVGRAFKIIADSGIRRGSDIVKYMAAGADAVLLGRATLYGAAAGGEAGASEVLKILQQEIDHCLAFAGHRDFTNIGENLYLQQ